MKSTTIHLILTKLKDLAAEVNTGTIILLLSGLVLYADKVINYFDLQIAYEFKYYGSLEVFVWACAVTVTPLMMVLGVVIDGQKWSLGSPLAAYSVQAMYIMRDEHWIQRDYFWHHTFIFIICFVVLAYVLNNYATTIRSLKRKIRVLMNLMVVKTIDMDLVKDIEVYTEEIIEPALNTLND